MSWVIDAPVLGLNSLEMATLFSRFYALSLPKQKPVQLKRLSCSQVVSNWLAVTMIRYAGQNKTDLYGTINTS